MTRGVGRKAQGNHRLPNSFVARAAAFRAARRARFRGDCSRRPALRTAFSLAAQEFLPVTPVMEGTVILTPNPDYKPPRVEEDKKK